MGNSNSSNASKVIVEAVSAVATDLVQQSQIHQDSSQIISVDGSTGPVRIDNNRMSQRASLNVRSLMKAMATESSRQKVAAEIAQRAKSLMTGLNVAQFSSASNTMDGLVKSAVSVLSSISDSCSTTVGQRQAIVVEHVGGQTMVINNLLEQISDAIGDCVQTAVNDSQTVNETLSKMDQAASATANGLTGWVVVAALALAIGLPVVGGAVVGVALLKYLFPLMIVLGVAAIVAYFYFTAREMSAAAYRAGTIDGTCSGSVKYVPVAKDGRPVGESFQRAVEVCLADDRCIALDWDGQAATGRATFYSYVPNGCRENVERDASSANDVSRVPDLYSGDGAPSIGRLANRDKLQAGDIYVDTKTSDWYQFEKTAADRFRLRGPIVKDAHDYSRIIVNYADPTNGVSSGSVGNLYVWYDRNDPDKFQIFRYTNSSADRWTRIGSVPGPGMYTSIKRVTRCSAFDSRRRRTWLLVAGIGFTVVGLIGTVVSANRGGSSRSSRH